MNTLTVKSLEDLDEQMQLDVHYALGMEFYTDYVFKPEEGNTYSATIVPENTAEVIRQMASRSVAYPDLGFEIEVLDVDSNLIERYFVKNGSLVDKSPG